MAIPIPPVPPRHDLLRLARAALSNAADLLADARLLAEAARFPRAHALATLACEELGKEQQCLSTVWLPLPIPKVFWARFYNHKEKLVHAQSEAALESGSIGSGQLFNEHVRRESRSAHERKLRGLFVDYADGALQLPSDVTEPETWQLIDRAQRVLDRDEASWPERAAEVERRSQWPLFHRLFFVLFLGWVADNDPDVIHRLHRDRVWPLPVLEDLLQRYQASLLAEVRGGTAER